MRSAGYGIGVAQRFRYSGLLPSQRTAGPEGAVGNPEVRDMDACRDEVTGHPST